MGSELKLRSCSFVSLGIFFTLLPKDYLTFHGFIFFSGLSIGKETGPEEWSDLFKVTEVVRGRILGPDHNSQDNVHSHISQGLSRDGFLIQKRLKSIESFTKLFLIEIFLFALKKWQIGPREFELEIFSWYFLFICFICVGEYVMLFQEPFSDSRGSIADLELWYSFLTAEFWYAKYFFFPLIPACLVWFLSQSSHFMRRILPQKLTKKSNFLNCERVEDTPESTAYLNPLNCQFF